MKMEKNLIIIALICVLIGFAIALGIMKIMEKGEKSYGVNENVNKTMVKEKITSEKEVKEIAENVSKEISGLSEELEKLLE